MRIAAHLAVGLAVGLSLLPLRLLVEDPALPVLTAILLGATAAVGTASPPCGSRASRCSSHRRRRWAASWSGRR